MESNKGCFFSWLKCFDWKFGLVLGGWVPSRIEVIWVPGIYTYYTLWYTNIAVENDGMFHS